MTALYKNGEFMGAVLVAEKGKIIYEKGLGFADKQTKDPFLPSTPCYVGSISKQFTAMGIVLLKEKRLLDFNQSIRRYFPQLPACYQPVTLLNILHHSSGLPIFDDYPGMTEKEVFNILLKQTSLRFVPGSKFEYCNANYSLLGMLIEQLSGKTLDEFLTANVFIPCDMKNTYVDEPAATTRRRAVGYYIFGDKCDYSTYIGGAASVVSTVEDLYRWDQTLYHPTIISKKSLEEIFMPDSNEWVDKTYGKEGYGFGWFISGNPENKVIRHDGGFAGFRAYIEREVSYHNSIIFISNVRHDHIDDIRDAIVDILNDKPFSIPKVSAANWIMRREKETGMKEAILDYRSMMTTKDSSRYNFSEYECNSLAYYLLRNNKMEEAIEFFTLNTQQFPNSGNVFDSMGEAYLKTGDKENALKNYKRALQLDPGNTNAAAIIASLTSPTPTTKTPASPPPR
jgi:CubicO group peptidase (beta-lactamase class C family)